MLCQCFSMTENNSNQMADAGVCILHARISELITKLIACDYPEDLI